jgi:hypothetical protein
VASQRFPETVLRTVEYLNATMRSGRFVAVEIIAFEGAGLAAFESRTILKPSKVGPSPKPIDFEDLLARFGDPEYRDALRSILEACRGFGFVIALGSVGLSIRKTVSARPTPVSVGWLFPGDVGWYGLRDFTLGYEKTPSIPLPDAAIPILEEFLTDLAKLAGTEKVSKKGLTGFRISREALVRNRDAVIDVLLKVGERLASLS